MIMRKPEVGTCKVFVLKLESYFKFINAKIIKNDDSQNLYGLVASSKTVTARELCMQFVT